MDVVLSYDSFFQFILFDAKESFSVLFLEKGILFPNYP